MATLGDWIKSHVWVSVVAAFLLGIAFGAGGSTEEGSADFEAELSSARTDQREVERERDLALEEVSESNAQTALLEDEVSELTNELDALEGKLAFIRSKASAPDLSGMTVGDVRSLASNNGWKLSLSKQVSSLLPGTVISQTPPSGATVHSGSLISVVIAKPAPTTTTTTTTVKTTTAPTTSGCTPGYSPCLPPASDYDCSGGSGDGPKYTGYVTVTGSDPYGLDSDGDGVGCES